MTIAQPQQQEDNDLVRVTRWQLPSGSETGHHVHELDYVIVPVTNGVLSIVEDDGNVTEAPLRVGISYFRRAGVSHNVTNRTSTEIVFVEVEVKSGKG